jgi:hypothetical protein
MFSAVWIPKGFKVPHSKGAAKQMNDDIYTSELYNFSPAVLKLLVSSWLYTRGAEVVSFLLTLHQRCCSCWFPCDFSPEVLKLLVSLWPVLMAPADQGMKTSPRIQYPVNHKARNWQAFNQFPTPLFQKCLWYPACSLFGKSAWVVSLVKPSKW